MPIAIWMRNVAAGIVLTSFLCIYFCLFLFVSWLLFLAK